jgi:UDP-N-acetylmuramoyl-tripeptide--D-alanyl-D-alanine ligase
MALFTIEEILEVTSARLVPPAAAPKLRQGVERVTTDSREAGHGDLFIALPGERYDGHAFVSEALRKGAVAAVVSRVPDEFRANEGHWLLKVEDTVRAYQQLAGHHRLRFDVPIVAVTGSNGKTTTKEMVAAVLSERGTVLKTAGNLNNRIGVPRTLLELTPEHQAAVIEMGVDQLGQTSRLCEIVRPTIGVITNIGPDHLEWFGTLEASAQAKAELLDYLHPDDTAVLNADDVYFDYLAARARCRVVSFGGGEHADVRAEGGVADNSSGMTLGVHLPGRARPTKVMLPAHGAHNVSNALAAAAVGYVLGMKMPAIGRGLGRFRPAAMRSEVMAVGGITLINDCYNANPALDLLSDLGRGRRSIAVLGDMLELGPTASALHREVGEYAARKGIGHLVAVGDLARDIAAGARRQGFPAESTHEVPTAAEAAKVVKALLDPQDVVLIKASRRLRLEDVVDQLKVMIETR